MNWFSDAKIATKLLIAFVLCAVITLIVGALGSRGIAQLSANLNDAFTNNVYSVAKSSQAKASAVAQSRDLYRLLSAATENSPQSEKDEIIRNGNREHDQRRA